MEKTANLQVGDLVKVVKVKETIEGILLDSHDSEIVLLKLKSGYNIGILKEEILRIDLVEKSKKEEIKEEKTQRKEGLKNIAVIITGGTISSRLDPKTGAVSSITEPSQLLALAPEVKEICNITKIEIPFMMFSENMSSKEWIILAETAEKLLNDDNIHGIIITHGTDFLHYSSAALSFFLPKPGKPIVLTYSQRSSDRGSSDAKVNLICSARAAVSDIAEVMLVGHATLNDDFCYAMPGTKVRKMHASRRDTFKIINGEPIAKIYPNKEIEILKPYKKRGKTESDIVFNDKIALIDFYPGQSPEILDYYAEKGFKGAVLLASGLGHLPTGEKNNWLPTIKRLSDKGFTICAAAQTIYGKLDPYVYSPGRELLKAGVIFLEDMLGETAFVKLGWVLAHPKWKTSIKEKMQENIAGEISERLEISKDNQDSVCSNI